MITQKTLLLNNFRASNGDILAAMLLLFHFGGGDVCLHVYKSGEDEQFKIFRLGKDEGSPWVGDGYEFVFEPSDGYDDAAHKVDLMIHQGRFSFDSQIAQRVTAIEKRLNDMEGD